MIKSPKASENIVAFSGHFIDDDNFLSVTLSERKFANKTVSGHDQINHVHM